MSTRNFKLYTIGVDLELTPTLLTFLIYGVDTIDEAKTKVITSKHHKRVLTKYRVSKAEAKFTAFRCDDAGVTNESERSREEKYLNTFAGRTSVSFDGGYND